MARNDSNHSDDNEKRQLQQTCQQLVREFGDKVPEAEVQARFAETVHGFDGVPVRSFVPVLAGRVARQRLKDLAAAS